MKIVDINIFKYNLKLRRPLIVHNLELPSREGLIVQFISETGAEGFGEIAPLPGFSKTSLQEALSQMINIKENILDRPLPEDLEKLNGGFTNWMNNFDLVSPVMFGIEMGILNMLANAKEKPLYKIISKSSHTQIRINGLLQGSLEDVKAQARELSDSGFSSMKLKVDGQTEECIEKVHAVNEVIKNRAVIHLDANQSWDFKEAVSFGNSIGCAAVEYIEEPFSEIEMIPEFFMQTTIPVALDESIITNSFDDLKSIEGVDFLVLKPSFQGGIEKTLDLVYKSQKLAIHSIISSTFESGIGLLTLANLAGCIQRDIPAGLDTLKWFEEDLLKEPLRIEKGKIDISKRSVTSEDIRFDLLEKV